MRRLTHQRLAFIFLISVLWTFDGFSQTSFDAGLVSDDKELNFAFTDKRGIRADNGIVYFVEKGGQILTAYDNKSNVKWTTDILRTCSKPAGGKSEIRYIKLANGEIELTFGKHDFASVEIANGKVKCLGAD